jgi:hypothetical protein
MLNPQWTVSDEYLKLALAVQAVLLESQAGPGVG